MTDREHLVYLAKLAEQAERYDEMVVYMVEVARLPHELGIEERTLLSVAFSNAVGRRRAAWRSITSVEKKAASESTIGQAAFAAEYRKHIEAELEEKCNTIIALLEELLLTGRESSNEAKVFYHKMKADYLRYIAEFATGDKKDMALERSRRAHEQVQQLVSSEFAATDPIRLGLALSLSMYQHDIIGNLEEAIRIARTALDDAMAELDNVKEDSYKDAMLIMQLLRDNMTLWTSGREVDP
eukprot:TRINITY_DN2828_c1_g1_i1.p1 TRINITY_DN2828_c1_g1~~TRINITY_DN2828_c1_g1_i1.p1  ORF type:complete len:241 (+),score=51.00 TRINITY_DN2828_c1_g1_i1:74-796(+)